MRASLRVTAALAALLASVACFASACGDGGEPPPPARGLEVVDEQDLTADLREYTFRTPSVREEVKARVLLPSGYEDSGRRYPVLYLLHGAGADAAFWTSAGIESLVRDLPLIVVMPDADTGFYSDWFNDGAGGPPRWESFHIDELIPWVDTEFRTRDDHGGRAIAGASMGGLGAILYAARDPRLFDFAASFSGSVEVEPASMARLMVATGRDPAILGPIWGAYPDHAGVWRSHDPIDLATNLDDVELVLSTGNGQLPGGEGRDPVEAQIWRMNLALHRRLQELGIDHIWDAYGPGAHDLPHWRDALARALPLMMGTLGARVSYVS